MTYAQKVNMLQFCGSSPRKIGTEVGQYHAGVICGSPLPFRFLSGRRERALVTSEPLRLLRRDDQSGNALGEFPHMMSASEDRRGEGVMEKADVVKEVV